MAIPFDRDILCIGDVVTFYGDDVGGYMYCQDPVNSDVLVTPTSRDRPLLSNVLGAAFEILVADKYRANKTYGKMLKALKTKEGEHHKTFTTLAGHDPALRNAQRLAKAERQDNAQEQKRMRGKHVVYGMVVQFRHRLTGKYLYVSSSETATTENTNMKVELGDYPSKNTRFFIMPRYKVRAEGDVVRHSDKIAIESCKTASSFIHCSKFQFAPTSYNANQFEVNLSVDISSWTILFFQRREDELNEAIESVYAGDSLRFLHKESESYISAEGNAFYPVREDVHLRLREQNQLRPHSLVPPTGPSMFWQVELDGSAATGDMIKWEALCRFRHGTSRRYMAVVSDAKFGHRVSLVEDPTDPRTVFRLHAVTKHAEHLTNAACVRIEHALTKTWLHAEKTPMEHARYKDIKHDNTLKGMQADDATLFPLTALPTMQYDDAFILQTVSQTHIDDTNFAAGCVPTLATYYEHRMAGLDVTPQEYATVRRTLIGLLDSMKIDDVESKQRQKQLRHLLIIDLLVECIFSHPNSKKNPIKLEQIVSESRHKLILQLCGLMCEVFDVYMGGESRKNENYFAQFVERLFVLVQYGDGFNAAPTLAELVTNNLEIIQRVQHSNIDFILNLLAQQKNPVLLRFLSQICVCDGNAMTDHQNYICEQMLIRGSGKYLFTTKVVNRIIEVQTHPSAAPITLKKFCQLKGSSEKLPLINMTGDDAYQYLVNQLALFSHLCASRNTFCTETITTKLQYLDWNTVFTAVQDDAVLPDLRAVYCDSLTNLFLNVGENYDALQHVKLTYAWNDVEAHPYQDSAGDPCLSMTGCHLEYFPVLRSFIDRFLADTGAVQAASEIAKNQLLSAVLNMTKTLVSYGYYEDLDDMKSLFRPLFNILNGQVDVPDAEGAENAEEWRKSERFHFNPDNRALVNAKVRALEIFELFVNFRFDIRMQHFLYDFKLYEESNQRLRRHSTRVRMGFSSHANGPHGPNSADLAVIADFAQRTRSPKELESRHRDAIRHMDLLFRRSDFLDAPAGTAVADSLSFSDILLDLCQYQFDDMVIKCMSVLDRLHSQNEDLFRYAENAKVLVLSDSLEVLEQVNKVIPLVRQILQSNMSDAQGSVLSDHFFDLMRLCELRSDATEPHVMNQSIIYNSGIVDDLLDLLNSKQDLLKAENSGARRACASAFLLLQKLARRNVEVQQRLFVRLSALLRHVGCEREMALCLIEIFNGNQDTCLKVREKDILKIVRLLARTKHAEYLRLLSSLIMLEEFDTPLRKNQQCVIKFMMQYRQDVLLLISDEENAERIKLLRQKTETEVLSYHIALVDILSTCAEDDNKFVESVCQTIFSIDELMEVLDDDQIPPTRKTPYLRFFVNVYLHVSSADDDLHVSNLLEDSRVWAFVARCASFVEALVEQIQKLDKSGALRNHAGRAASLSRARAEQALAGYAASRHGTEAEERFDFVIRGLAPFMTFLCQAAIKHETAHAARMGEKEMHALTVSLLSLQTVASVMIDRPREAEVLCAAILLVARRSGHISSELELKLQKLVQASSRIEKAPKPCIQEYLLTYQKEIELNQRLQLFVSNLKGAFAASRTQRYRKRDTLPKSEEFQSLVSNFVKYNRRGGRVISTIVQPSAERLGRALQLTLDMDSRKEDTLRRVYYLRTRFMHILRALVENERIRNYENLDTKMAAIKVVQDKLNDYRIPFICTLFFSATSDELVREALLLANVLLFGGNPNVQKSLADYCLQSREERLFMDLKSRISRGIVNIREFRSLKYQIESAAKERESIHLTMTNRNTLGRRSANEMSVMTSIIELDTDDGIPPTEAEKAAEDAKMIAAAGNASKPDAVATAAALARFQEETNSQIAELKFHDETSIGACMKLMARLCDGFNYTFKNYLRDQPDNFKRVNLVQETMQLLHVLYEYISKDNVDLVILVLDTLLKLCAGSEENQACVFDAHILDIINRIFRVMDYPGLDLPKIAHLKYATAKLAYTLIEDTCESSKAIAAEYAALLDFKFIHFNMNRYHYEAKVATNLGYDLDGDEEDNDVHPRDVAVSLYILLARVADINNTDELAMYDPIRKDKNLSQLYSDLDAKRANVHSQKDVAAAVRLYNQIDLMHLPPAYGHYEKRVGSIEIMRNNKLQKVYFWRKPEAFSSLTQRMKDWLVWNLQRTSPANKVRDFVDKSDELMNEMKHHQYLLRHWFTHMIVRGGELWMRMIMIFTVVINLVMLATYDHDPVNMTNGYKKPDVNSAVRDAITVLGSFHLFFCFMFTLYVLADIPPRLKRVTKRANEPDPKYFETIVLFYRRNRDRISQLLYLRYAKPLVLYCLLACTFSALGIVYSGYFFALHLLHIIVRNDLLNRVISSVTKNGGSLLWVVALGFSVVYMYSVASFVFIASEFDPTAGQFCDSLWHCFITCLSLGFLSSGGLGDAISAPASAGFFFRGLHVLYEVSFYIVITLIMLNIVFGIIVDTFGQLRDEKSRIIEDKSTTCSICSLDAYDFERHGNGFRYHTRHEHCMWDYLFFFVHLDSLPDAEMNVNEHHVEALRKKGASEAVAFFPINHALALGEVDEDLALLAINRLVSKMDTLVARHRQFDRLRDAEEEKQRQDTWQEQALSTARK